jgi:hypothetical protein
MVRVLVTILLLSPAALADITDLDNNKTVTVDCAKDPNVTLNGNQNTYKLAGSCALLSVNGNQNTVEAERVVRIIVAGNNNTVHAQATDSISTTGNRNTVSWSKAVTAGRDAPTVSNPGDHNSVNKAK